MDRRKFVKTTLAASVAATFPVLTACGKKAKVATEADTSIRGISLDGAEIELEKASLETIEQEQTRIQNQIESLDLQQNRLSDIEAEKQQANEQRGIYLLWSPNGGESTSS